MIKKVNDYLETLNDRLFGINQKKKVERGVDGESKYWKDLTGLSKKQFMYAAKKEKDEFMIFGGFASSSYDINILN